MRLLLYKVTKIAWLAFRFKGVKFYNCLLFTSLFIEMSLSFYYLSLILLSVTLLTRLTNDYGRSNVSFIFILLEKWPDSKISEF